MLAVSNPSAAPGVPGGEPRRSRLDPNGVIYHPWGTFDDAGVVAVRAHPLPPAWLVVERWQGTLAAGEEMGRFYLGSTVILLFEAGAVEWLEGLKAGSPVRMGQPLARKL